MHNGGWKNIVHVIIKMMSNVIITNHGFLRGSNWLTCHLTNGHVHFD
jgi:hypothetical protein